MDPKPDLKQILNVQLKPLLSLRLTASVKKVALVYRGAEQNPLAYGLETSRQPDTTTACQEAHFLKEIYEIHDPDLRRVLEQYQKGLMLKTNTVAGYFANQDVQRIVFCDSVPKEEGKLILPRRKTVEQLIGADPGKVLQYDKQRKPIVWELAEYHGRVMEWYVNGRPTFRTRMQQKARSPNAYLTALTGDPRLAESLETIATDRSLFQGAMQILVPDMQTTREQGEQICSVYFGDIGALVKQPEGTFSVIGDMPKDIVAGVVRTIQCF